MTAFTTKYTQTDEKPLLILDNYTNPVTDENVTIDIELSG